MKIKKSYKMLIALGLILISLIAVNAGLANSVAEVGGGVMEKAVHIVHFNF